MSLPPSGPPQLSGGSSPDMLAIMAAFIMHSAARHINFELTDAQKKLLSMPISKAVILAALFYISTRSIKWTIVLLALYFIVINMLLNENHPLNIFSPGWLLTQGFLQNNEINKSYTDLYMKNISNFH
jgi:hypothetical protein